MLRDRLGLSLLCTVFGRARFAYLLSALLEELVFTFTGLGFRLLLRDHKTYVYDCP